MLKVSMLVLGLLVGLCIRLACNRFINKRRLAKRLRCVDCGKKLDHVSHVQPRLGLYLWRLDRPLAESLCSQCWEIPYAKFVA